MTQGTCATLQLTSIAYRDRGCGTSLHRDYSVEPQSCRLETMPEALHDAQGTRCWAERKLRLTLNTSGSPHFRPCLLKQPDTLVGPPSEGAR